MKSLIIILFTIFGLNFTVTKSEICEIQRIKYLSTFESSKWWDFIGGNSIVDLNAAIEIDSMVNGDLSFYSLIPVLIKQIDQIYSDSKLDENEKNTLIVLSSSFAKILKDNQLKMEPNPSDIEICESVNKIIDLYHSIAEDNNTFFRMIYTLDDGPFYGFDTEETYEFKDSIKIEKLNSSIIIRSNNKGINTLELEDINKKILWKKIIARSEEYTIETLDFANHPLRLEDELGFKIAFYGDGEFLNLYLSPEGKFKCFFHSW